MHLITDATFVTTTTYGTWLPGDTKGYSDRGLMLPSCPPLEQYSKAQLKKQPVFLSHCERDLVFNALVDGSSEFGYRLSDVAVEAWHLHWMIWHNDSVDVMIGRLKTRMRQSLDRGRIWTEGYSSRHLMSDDAILDARQYIARHRGCRMLDGQCMNVATDSSQFDGTDHRLTQTLHQVHPPSST
jgi:hypothetical protein